MRMVGDRPYSSRKAILPSVRDLLLDNETCILASRQGTFKTTLCRDNASRILSSSFGGGEQARLDFLFNIEIVNWRNNWAES